MKSHSSEKPLRVFHGPVNIGGIGRYLADWQRQQGIVSDFITYEDRTNRRNNHFNLHREAYGLLAKIAIEFIMFLLVIVKYDVFHFYFSRTMLPCNLDLPFLKLFGKKMIMTYCGSEVRLIEVEEQRNPYHRFLRVGLDHPRWDKWKKMQLFWQNLWIDQFIAPRDMYAPASQVIPKDKIIRDIWVHNTMDLKAYKPEFATKKHPLLVHAPSNPAIKGSVHVEQAIADLRADGYKFEYIRLEKVPNNEAQRIYREDADIIIDQFYLGAFGQLAIEGMYFGKPVCGFITDEMQRELPDLPIVNCTVDNLTEKLAWLIEHPDERVRLGKAGRAFIEKHCDREKINVDLLQVYRGLMGG